MCKIFFNWSSIKSFYTKTWSAQINNHCPVICLSLLIWKPSLRLLQEWIENWPLCSLSNLGSPHPTFLMNVSSLHCNISLSFCSFWYNIVSQEGSNGDGKMEWRDIIFVTKCFIWEFCDIYRQSPVK